MLPFDNMSPDPGDTYFSDGITEEIINSLANLSGLRVIARTSAFAFRGKNVDVREIGRTLGVGRVLEGSVRKFGNRLRITAQLIDVDDGAHVWSESYDRDFHDVFAIQSDIAARVTGAVEVRLLPAERERLQKPAARNVEAYNLYLLGLHHQEQWAPENMRRSIDYLDQALAIDPEYPQAYAALAYAYMQRGASHGDLRPAIAIPKAKEAVTRALEIDDTTAEAHAVLGTIKTVFDWEWEGAEREYLRALELSPGFALGHQDYGYFLSAVARHDEALREAALAVSLDPLSWTRRFDYAWFLYCARRFEDAVEQLAKALEIDRANYLSNIILGWCYAALGEADAAGRELDMLATLDIQHPTHLSYVASISAQVGRMSDARKILERLEALPSDPRNAEPLSLTHVALGQVDAAFEWLERAYEERLQILNFLHSPLFDGIRAEPRLKELLVRIGLEPQGGGGDVAREDGDPMR